MRIPTLTGTIDRRILINYQAEKEVIEKFLPATFKPKLVKGKAIVGICLIRLKNVRPKGVPFNIGISSENGAHRIAVEWQENGVVREGVYVPRRDTSSRLNSLAGGKIFPGVHYLADFRVNEGQGRYDIEFKSEDGTFLAINASETKGWSASSVFDDLEDASDFFKQGSIGYSPNKANSSFDGLELKTKKWQVAPLNVSKVTSTFFDNRDIFPEGSIAFDNALLMKDIDHEWRSQASLENNCNWL
jgi:hypothetical protein